MARDALTRCVWCGREGSRGFSEAPASMLPFVADLLLIPAGERDVPVIFCDAQAACSARRRQLFRLGRPMPRFAQLALPTR